MKLGIPAKLLDRIILAVVGVGLIGLLIVISFFEITTSRFYFSGYMLVFGAMMLVYDDPNKKLLTVTFLIAGIVWFIFNLYIHHRFPTAA